MSSMNASAGTGVFVLSLLSIPINYLFNYLVISNSVEVIFGAGVSVVVILALLAKMLLKKKAPADPLFYVYAIFAILSVVNLTIGLEQDGIIDGFMTFYLKQNGIHVLQADPYINTAHGHMISYWDGCAHYLMYLLMVAAITWGESYRTIGLYWVGSFLMQVIVYIPGNVVGKYGVQLNSMFQLHMLYVCTSVWACFRVFSQPTTWDLQISSVQCEQKKTVLQRPVDFLFIFSLLAAAVFCVFRGFVALDCPSEWSQNYVLSYEPYLKDPSAYPKVQMLVNMLYSTPCFVLTIYGLLIPGCAWLPDLSLVHAGAVAQAQFCHTGASLHTRTPFAYRVPAMHRVFFLILNLLYAILPQAISYRCISDPTFFTSQISQSKND